MTELSAETLRESAALKLAGNYWWVVNFVAKPYDLKQMAAYGTIQSGKSCQIVHMALELGPARQYSRIWGPGRLALQGIRILKLQHKEAKPPGCLQSKEGGWVGAISWDNASKLDVIIMICLKRILYSKRYVWNRTKVEREESHSLEEVSFFLEGWRATFHGRWSSIPLIRLEYRNLCSVHQVLLFPSIYSHFNRNWWILICSMQVLCHD